MDPPHPIGLRQELVPLFYRWKIQSLSVGQSSHLAAFQLNYKTGQPKHTGNIRVAQIKIPLCQTPFFLSLALIGETETGKNWSELLTELSPKKDWITALSICSGLIDDQLVFFRALDPKHALEVFSTVPLAPAHKIEILERVISPMGAEEMEKWLRGISKEVPDLVPNLARLILGNAKFDKNNIQETLTLSFLNQLAGNDEVALKLLEEASEQNQKFHGKLAANLNKVRTNLDQPRLSDKSWKELKESLGDPDLAGENVQDITEVIRSLLDNKLYAAAGDLLTKIQDPLPDNPELLTALAEYALSQDQKNRADQLAGLALEKSLVSDSPPLHLGSVLFQLGKMDECVQAAQAYLSKHPDHLETHVFLANALSKMGDHSGAAKQAQMASILKPKDISILKELAGHLEEAESWKEALDTRSEILSKLQSAGDSKSDLQPYLPLEDLVAFASSALNAAKYQRAITACNQILEQDEENSPAHVIKGKALSYLGIPDDGVAYLKRAVELTPEQEEPWIALAENQLVAQNPSRAIQLLKSGLSAVKTQGKILLKLGQIHHQNNNSSEALKIFKKAADVSSTENLSQKTIYEIQYGLGWSYFKLGHLDQAREIYKDLLQRYPSNRKTGEVYGQLLLDMGDPKSALPYLTQALDSKPTYAKPYLQFADAQLQVRENPIAAAKAVQDALSIEPENPVAQVLLGEAQAACGEHQKALNSFQQVSDQVINSDPSWGPRISRGLGQSALELGHIETAITSLKEGQERFPLDLALAKGLAEAYAEGNLVQNALETAKEAANIAPLDQDLLSWLADFTLNLGSPEQGISALKKLIRINPEHHSAYIHLGKAQASAGNQKEASNAFSKILEFEDVQPEILLQAGDELIKLGKLDSGMKCLSKAASICEVNVSPLPLMPKIWSRLAAGHEQIGDSQKSLELLDQAISADLDNPEWRIQKADLLIRQDRLQAAIASLSNALDLSPDEPALHAKMARVQHKVSSFEESFYHVQEALAGYMADEKQYQEKIADTVAFAADLACATLRPEQAEKILSSTDLEKLGKKKVIPTSEVHALCLEAEIAIDQNQEVRAAEISNLLVSKECVHPRSLALQARIINRQGDLNQAKTAYQNAVEAWQNMVIGEKTFSTAVEIALGKTAHDLQLWAESQKHFLHAADQSPTEKRVLMELAQSFLCNAETRRFSESLKALRRVPDQIVLSSEYSKSFQECINALSGIDVDPKLVEKLRVRGDAVFTPSQESAEKLKACAETPDEIAALISAYRHSRQKIFAKEIALDNLSQLGTNVFLDGQIALALIKMKPEVAYKAAASALETAKRSNHPQLPLFFVLLASASREINDLVSADEAIQKALQIWDDEPRWFALAAEMTPDYPEAVKRYSKAIELEPEFANHYLALGKLHIDAKQPLPGIKALEKAISLKPDYIDAWIHLALGKRAMHQLQDALTTINKAINMAPDHKEARKTAALLSFEKGNYRESENHLVSLLGQNPNDTDLMALFARTLAAQKQPDQALQVIDKAISLEENSLDLELQRVNMIKAMDGPLAAIDELRIIGSHYPDQYPLVYELVSTLAEAGEIDQAVKTAQDILQNDEIGHTPEQKAHLYLTTGRLLRKTGQLDQAVNHLYKAKKLVDPNYEAIIELGRVHNDRRQYKQALEEMLKAIEIEPDQPEGYYQAGRILKELKEYNRAERMLRKASKLAPHDLKIHRQLGVLVTLNLVHGDPRKEVMV